MAKLCPESILAGARWQSVPEIYGTERLTPLLIKEMKKNNNMITGEANKANQHLPYKSGKGLNTKEPLVSVIIPVFNKAEYIAECLSCVIRQTWKNLEIIVIDDDSTDESFSHIQTAAQEDSRIKFHHIDHSGVSAARNRGMELAHGEYIAFIDADDLVRMDYIEVLLSAIKDAEISMCPIWIWNQLSDSVKIQSCETAEYSKTDFLKSKATLWNLCSNVFAKLYRASFLKQHHISFQESMDYGEDTLFFYSCLQYTEHIHTVNHTGYLYREETGSSLVNKGVFDLQKNELLISALQLLSTRVQDESLRSYVFIKQLTLLYVIGKIECFQRIRKKRGAFFFSCAGKYDLKRCHCSCFRVSKSAALVSFILRINHFAPFYFVIKTFYKNVKEKRIAIQQKRYSKSAFYDDSSFGN